MKDNYKRLVQKSVTVFIHHKNEYLFLKRSLNKQMDPGKLNGVGGKLESGENYLEAAIRETQEETGYIVNEKDIKLAGVVVLEEGYTEDWVMCFFKINVRDKTIPKGSKTEDGEFIWINKDKILKNKLNLVDDLNHSLMDIISGKLFFMNCKFNDDEKIVKYSKSIL
jgi:ADP-ribose pyrophosphatase